jgi:hypothetical protein
MTVALITTSPSFTIVATYPQIPNPVALPNGAKVFGAGLGTVATGYKLVAVTPFIVPGGDIAIGSPTYSIDGSGNVTENYETETTPPALTAASLIAAGLAVTSTGTPSLNATYAIDPTTQGQIIATEAYIDEYGTFFGGATTLQYPDITGALHTFPSVTEFRAFAKTVADYVAAVELTANVLTAGGTATWPSDASIP